MKVVILMSTYNGEKYLREQLDSLMSLDDKSDIFIRDDGSSDETINIIKYYQSKFDNIMLLKGSNVGVVASFFELMKAVDFYKYDYFAFCDQDDFWEHDKVSRAISCIKNTSGPVLYCSRLKVVDEFLNFKFLSPFPQKGLSFSNALVENIITGCTCVLNRLAFQRIVERIPESKRIVMHDWWFYLVLINEGTIFFDDRSFIKYRQHGNNIEGMKKSFSKIINKFISTEKNKYPSLSVQLDEYYRLYVDKLTKDNKDILEQLHQVLLNRDLLCFVRLLISRKIYRQSIMDNISLLYSFLTKRI
ncbi:glycosyltransferase family 2 protein [Escherichia albertii]|uniref:glycosyltransferase family 2 protein n=1 Tax=Escherichia albertii TaxID=208962 RepID=UPI0016B4332F|nr:glycosyltransferase family 2 protein [Escherichia albertii]MCQ8909755.1 glycosyltransferase family 2 protein [Escherichia albertii]MCQ8958667.1 glycosyltransferase family 2 protein [Escherichia albertii]MCQ8990297.1 glycosyltransferase family 2 protein [Escherichia albertii]UUL29300.1 glycosyltransferase family 2 protein [Escherichia albertii]UUL47558.1 glycosyltransferase family 2 protein [Escherichia albertii]